MNRAMRSSTRTHRRSEGCEGDSATPGRVNKGQPRCHNGKHYAKPYSAEGEQDGNHAPGAVVGTVATMGRKTASLGATT